MPNLSNEYLNKSQFLSKLQDPQVERATAAAVADEKIRGIRISLLGDKYSRLSVVADPRAFLLAALVPIVYIFAGESVNQWYYFLAGAILSCLLIGFLAPLIQILDVSTSCLIPTNAVNNEQVQIKVTLNRKGILGQLSHSIPLRWLGLKANLVSHLGRTSVVRSLSVESIGEESWLFASTTPLQ